MVHGGGYSVAHMLDNPALAACAVYYGRLVDNPEPLKKGAAPIIGIFGNEDKNPSPEMVQAFETALQQAGREYRIYRYAGAGHAFANPSGGERYRPEAAADANVRVLAFLREKLMR